MKVKYQLAVTKKPLLSVIIKIDVYKTTRAKIKVYDEKYGRFRGLSNSTNVEGCKAPSDSWVI